MATEVQLPALSPTMKEGKIVKWLKKEGDSISSGEAIAEVETDKSNLEIESFEDGVLLKILVGEGETGTVGAPIAIVGAKGEKVSAPAPKAAAPAPAPSPAPAAAAPKSAPPPPPPPPAARPPPPKPAPREETRPAQVVQLRRPEESAPGLTPRQTDGA